MQIKMCKSGRNLILGGLGTFLFFLFAQEWLISSAYRRLIVSLSSAYPQLMSYTEIGLLIKRIKSVKF